MEENKTEITAPVVDTTPAASAPATSQEVKAPVTTVPAEPRHPLQDILDKAAAKKAASTSAPVAPQGTTEKSASAEPWNVEKWDGNPGTLPDKLKKIVTDNQAAFHQKAQEVAQLKQYKDAYDNIVQQMKAQQTNQPSITQEEFEAAQLDPNKFMSLVKKATSLELEKEKAALQPILNDLQLKQAVVENERIISDFANKNTDFWDLYDKGLIEPLVKVTGSLESAYTQAKSIANGLRQSAKQEMQQNVQQKKAASSMAPTTPQQIEVVYVDNSNDVLPTAAKYAMEGKKVKVLTRPR